MPIFFAWSQARKMGIVAGLADWPRTLAPGVKPSLALDAVCSWIDEHGIPEAINEAQQPTKERTPDCLRRVASCAATAAKHAQCNAIQGQVGLVGLAPGKPMRGLNEQMEDTRWRPEIYLPVPQIVG
jgi:hypothetical protein